MTSKNSAPKINTNKNLGSLSLWRLMREDLRHRTWMLVLSILGSFIASPVASLFFFSDIRYRSNFNIVPPEQWYPDLANYLIKYLGTAHLILQMIVIYVGVIIVAIFGFRHLFSQKMTDLYNCMPVTRTKLFWAQYLNGFLIWFVPFLTGHLFVYILTLITIGEPAYWSAISAVAFKEIALFVACFLILYNACLVPIMISGNIKNALLNILIYGLFICIGFATLILYMESYFDTCYLTDLESISPVIIGLSPLTAPIVLCLWFLEFHVSPGTLSSDAAGSNSWSMFLITVFVLLLVNLVLAVILHQKRPSELAQRGVENKYFRIPLRMITSVLSGLLLALFFAEMADSQGRLGWSIFGAIFGSILAFCVMNIMYHSSFKSILDHKTQLICCTLAVCGTLLVFHFDLTGYDRYLPAKESIQGISIYSDDFKGSGYKLVKEADGYFRTDVNNSSIPDELVFTDQDTIYNFLTLMAGLEDNPTQEYSSNQNNFHHYVAIRVYTSTGSYCRHYSFYATEEMNAALEPLVSNDDFIKHYNPIGTGLLEAPAKIQVTSLEDTHITITDPQAIQSLYQAYVKDFTGHYSFDNEMRRFHLLELEFMYPSSNKPDNYRYISLRVPTWYSNTIQALKELYPETIWSQEDLIFTSLDISIPSDYAGDQLSELKAYLGIGEAAADLSNNLDDTPVPKWVGTITEPAELEKLRPYLYLDSRRNYYNGEYVYLGTMTTYTSAELHSASSETYYCHIKHGEVPEWLLERLTLQKLN